MSFIKWLVSFFNTNEQNQVEPEQLRYQLSHGYKGNIPHERRKVYSQVLGNLWMFSNEELANNSLDKFIPRIDQQLLMKFAKQFDQPKTVLMAEAKEIVSFIDEPAVDEITLGQFELLINRLLK